MTFKRITALILSLVIMLYVPLINVNAIEYEVEIYTEISVPQNMLSANNGASNSLEDSLGSKYAGFKEYLRSELIKCNERIDISSYNIANNSVNQNALVYILGNEIPEAFHLNSSVSIYGTSSKITALGVQYTCTKAQYTKMYNEIETESAKILSGISGNNSLTDVQKALLIHDRIAVLCEYDNDGFVEAESYTIYGVLAKKIAVCQGYSETYKYLLEKVGIESYLCSSDKLYHSWNIVKIDGAYYHVDITWDDPTPDIIGRVNHTYFLLSTEALKTVNNGAHAANDFDTTPVSTTYDNYFWKNSDTAFQLIGNNLYYIDNNDEYLKTYSKSKLCDVNDIWYSGNGGYWSGNFSRLSSDGIDLLFTKSDAVYRYDLSTGKTEKIFTPENSYGKGYNIYGFKYEDSKLICELRDTPNVTSNVYKVMGDYAGKLNGYTLSYNANGGTGAPAEQKGNATYTIVASAPSRAGYKFLGWSDSSSSTTVKYKQGDSITLTKDTVLYAVWSKNSDVFVIKTFATVSGENSSTTVKIIKEGESVPLYNLTFEGVGEHQLELPELDNGKYSVVISKKNHVTRTCEVTIDSENKGFDLQINPIGDVSGDGKINAVDVALVNAHAKGIKGLTGYQFDCGEISGDEKINAVDVARVNAHAKGVKSLW